MDSESNRVRLTTWAMVGAAALVVVVMGYVQLFRWRHYEGEARKQQWVRVALPAARGRILDRMGRALVVNRSCRSIQILPSQVRGRDTAVAAVLSLFGIAERRDVMSRIRNNRSLFWLKRFVDYETGDSLKRLLIRRQLGSCVPVHDDNLRTYPHGASCANVVGFVGDDRGLAGIENYYDSVLRGRPGRILMQRDAAGYSYPHPSYPLQRPVPGGDVRLTLDLDVQEICFVALGDQVRATGAISGSAVVLDAETGAVLALTDFPAYDPNAYASSGKERHKVHAVTDQFEPGSVFKAVICAAALESPDARRLARQLFDVSKGYIDIGRRRIHDAHSLGVLDFPGIFIRSSNPGCAILSMQVDPERYYQIAKGLGFGSLIGIGLPGEASGRIDRPKYLDRLRFANVAFGQGVTVTLLQIAASYLCIARDGEYFRPYLVESVWHGTRMLYRSGTTRVRRVLRPQTCAQMKDILERAVAEGTGTPAQIDGATVCGKTGTAQKVDPVTRAYSSTRSLMSFVGFFPKEHPRYVVAVMLDEPSTERFATTAACPVFSRIGQRLLALERMRFRQSRDTLLLANQTGMDTRHETAGEGLQIMDRGPQTIAHRLRASDIRRRS